MGSFHCWMGILHFLEADSIAKYIILQADLSLGKINFIKHEIHFFGLKDYYPNWDCQETVQNVKNTISNLNFIL